MEEKPCGTEEFRHGVIRWETFKENQIVSVLCERHFNSRMLKGNVMDEQRTQNFVETRFS